MAKYNWSELEKEYLLGKYKSVSSFLKAKNISRSGAVQKAVKGWNEKKVQKEQKKSSKIIEKVIEKESEKEAKRIINIKDTANDLLIKINESMEELSKYFSRNKKKHKVIEYNNELGKPTKEVIDEVEEISEFYSIIDRKGLKELTSALKDVNDILENKSGDNGTSIAKEIEKAWSERHDK